MLAKRVIACLDVEDGIVVKGIKFKNIMHAGNPEKLASFYYAQGIDEIVFLDIGATYQSKKTLLNIVETVSNVIFIPLTVGGGIRSCVDIHEALKRGADKVAICSAIFSNINLVSEAVERFGSQCIVISIDAGRAGNSWQAYKHGGRINTGIDVIKFAMEVQMLGAGEILLNSIDRDGTKEGYDIELIKQVSSAVDIPVIASGGAGSLEHLPSPLIEGRADAVLLASMLHFNQASVRKIKEYLSLNGVNVRW